MAGSTRIKRAVLTGLGIVGLLGAALLVMTSTTWGRRQLVLLLDEAAPTSARTSAPSAATGSKIELQTVVSGLTRPVDIQAIPGQPGALVVLEKGGTAQRVHAGKAAPWFSVPVRTRSEQGLLGLAFHPRFSANGRFFLNYNPRDGDGRTRVAEWHADPATLAGPREVRVVLEVEQPYPNHNAGQLQFGPDGKLYIGFGDGGYADDPHDHGQNRGTLLGTMARIDVDAKAPYAVPPDNPFVGQADARPEVWAYGLRNPWRFAFAPDGRLVVGDVGQNLYEEIALVGRGENHGWKLREAEHCFPPGRTCTKGDTVDPAWSYPRALGASVTGGVVYTGKALPDLAGRYIFGDFASGRIWSMRLPKAGERAEDVVELGQWGMTISTFGRDAAGEVYVGDYDGGQILRLARQ